MENITEAPNVERPSETKIPEVERDVYYHLYACINSACVKDKNPQPYSVHMRGVHSYSTKPLNGVKCPGCGNDMEPVEHNASKEDSERENMHPKFVIYPAPGQEVDAL